jgi:hypothetical protein
MSSFQKSDRSVGYFRAKLHDCIVCTDSIDHKYFDIIFSIYIPDTLVVCYQAISMIGL